MRGEVVAVAVGDLLGGIIPAGAGRSGSGSGRRPAGWDHPRGCGEKSSAVTSLCRPAGSSPRVRGEADRADEEALGQGIIPAGAGRRQYQTIIPEEERDHPRGCGEKAMFSPATRASCGSSPRVRGEEGVGDALSERGGIIPAGAGRSHGGPAKRGRGGDHPRGCGEKPRIPRPLTKLLGSSPRVRGEVDAKHAVEWRNGIIPAGAGRSR